MFQKHDYFYYRARILLGFFIILVCILAIQIVLAFEFIFYYLFYEYNFLSEGSYVVIFISFALSIVTIRYLKHRMNSDNWEVIKTSEIQYSIDKLANNLQRVTFVVTYRTPDDMYQKSFQLKVKTTANLDYYLRKRLIEDRHEAVVYFNSLQKNLVFQYGITYIDLILAFVVTSIQVSLIFGTLILVSLKYNLFIFNENLILALPAGMPISFNYFITKLLVILAQNLIGYFILVGIFLTVLILVYLVKGLRKSGLKKSTKYPLFYDVIGDQTYNLVAEL